jgi:hypothetical protein
MSFIRHDKTYNTSYENNEIKPTNASMDIAFMSEQANKLITSLNDVIYQFEKYYTESNLGNPGWYLFLRVIKDNIPNSIVYYRVNDEEYKCLFKL